MDGIMAEPNHDPVQLIQELAAELRGHADEDRVAFARLEADGQALSARVDRQAAMLAEIVAASRAAARDAASGNRWSRAGTLLGGAIIAALVVFGALLARHVPWLFTR